MAARRKHTNNNNKKDQFGIEDFSISQPTLEQVFLRFAGDQDVAEEGSEDDDRSSHIIYYIVNVNPFIFLSLHITINEYL